MRVEVLLQARWWKNPRRSFYPLRDGGRPFHLPIPVNQDREGFQIRAQTPDPAAVSETLTALQATLVDNTVVTK